MQMWSQVAQTLRDHGQVAIATVTSTRGSAPSPVGTMMLVRTDQTVLGSVSGGCVEAEVYDEALAALADGRPRLRRYGISDEAGFAVGLTCGGEIEVLIEPLDATALPMVETTAARIETRRPVAAAVVVEHDLPARVGMRMLVTDDERLGGVGSQRADDAVGDDVVGLLAAGESASLTYGPDGERRGSGMRIQVEVWATPARLLIFGATDHAAALAKLGGFLGYDVTVCDARPVFTTPERFPHAAQVVVDWPDRYLAAENDAGRIDPRTAVVVLGHDPKFDVAVLDVALRLPELAYVGAMGSRRTHDDRLARLREAGLTEADLARLAGPIGLDLGGRTPEETALSIAAELVARRWGGSGTPLSRLASAVHRPEEPR